MFTPPVTSWCFALLGSESAGICSDSTGLAVTAGVDPGVSPEVVVASTWKIILGGRLGGRTQLASARGSLCQLV
jgi:hypothetical protein